LEELNQNPNVPTEVDVKLLLPGAQSGFANALSGRFFRYSTIMSQQLRGKDNQELLIENYNPDELFVGYPWEDFYAGPMINLKMIIDLAPDQNAGAYSGVAKVLLANCIGVLTDTWGDVPYSQALNGGDNLYPIYDSQEAIYAQIHILLDEAISELSEGSPISPASDDLIFQGDLGKWVSAAFALKARYYIHTTKRDAGAAQKALDALSQGEIEEFGYHYSGTNTDSNPINNFFTSTAYAVVDPQFIGVMGISDPRFEYFVDIIPFSGGQSKVGDFQGSTISPTYFMSYEEQLFIKAEAHLRLGNTSEAELSLRNAVQFSMDRLEDFLMLEIEDNEELDFIESLVLTGSFEENLEKIIDQKFVCLFSENEPWVDYRRTGYPLLESNDNGTSNSNPNGEIPRRLIYPQSERILNPNMPNGLDMQSRMWWDE